MACATRAIASREWCRAGHDQLMGSAMAAVAKEIERHERETGYRAAIAKIAEEKANG